MNILFLYRTYPSFGGVEVVTTVLADRFVEDGHEVTIVSFEGGRPDAAAHLHPSVAVRRLKFPLVSTANVARLHGILAERNIDIIVNQWGLPFTVTWLCRKAMAGTRCRLISVLHGAPDTSKVILVAEGKVREAQFARPFYRMMLKLKEEVVRWSIRYIVRRSDRYVLLSDRSVGPLVDYARLHDTASLRVINNPLTVTVEEFDMAAKKKQILYVGRMDYENKRVDRIVDIWERLAPLYPDWELVLVGDGPYKTVLLERIAKAGIPKVRFEAFRTEPPVAFYKEASLSLLASDLEGWGLVLVESMSYGVVPVVYGSYEAVHDIIDDGVSGFVVPKPYSCETMTERLQRLMDDGGLRTRMAAAAISAADRFDLGSIAAQWYRLFDEINARVL